jgi:SHS family sialic acid transporter-like MFS transporter
MKSADPKSTATTPDTTDAEPTISRAARWVVLLVAMLGWGSSGFQLAITSLIGQPAALDLLNGVDGFSAPQYIAANKKFGANPKPTESQRAESPELARYVEDKKVISRWFAWFTSAMLFGGASGGLFLGWLGDRFGRRPGLIVSILTSSLMALALNLAQTPLQLCIFWFLSCLGLGGMWPNGVAIISESWSGMSRSTVSGVMGAAANIGILMMTTLATFPKFFVTYDSWRWILFIAGSPLVLGIIAVFFLPESPRWLKLHRKLKEEQDQDRKTFDEPVIKPASMGEIFQGSLLPITLMAIVLATVPTMGGWGSAGWMVPWAENAGATPESSALLKAKTSQYRAFTGIIGSMLGGWIAVRFGRRLTYFATSFGCLCSAQITFWLLKPTDPAFLPMVAALGLFSGIYFGWLPHCMPEYFPTRNRSAGAGVSFNFGRIFTAVTVFTVGNLMDFFGGDYSRIGQVTSLIFLIGMIVIWFAPPSREGKLAD